MNKSRIMKHGSLLIATVLLAGIVAAGLFGTGDTETDGPQNIDIEGVQVGTSFQQEMKATEVNQQELTDAEPIPKMEDSLERENLKRRYNTLNDRDKVFHVYLMSYGKVVSYFTAQGKVSSVNSKLTQPEQVFRLDGCDGWKTGNDCYRTVSSPQLDGSYGTNGDAVFFYTTDGSYVEWNGEYLASERPLNIQTPVTLTKKVESEE